jgi:hypothetical protein
MTKSTTIGGQHGIAPLADMSTPSSAPTGGADKRRVTGARPGPQIHAALGGLHDLNSSRPASGAAGRTSFAAKPAASDGVGANAAARRPGMGGASSLLQRASNGLGGMGGAGGGLLQSASTLTGGVGGLAQAGAGLASAGMNILGSVMQVEQAETEAIAKVMEHGAQDVENAAKG